METLGYWICFFVGILIGKYVITSDFIRKLRERITGRRIRTTKTTDKDFNSKNYDTCPDCHGEEFVYDTELEKPVECPTCRGTGKVSRKTERT